MGSVLDMLGVQWKQLVCTQVTMVLVRLRESTGEAVGWDNVNVLNGRVKWGDGG